MSYYLRTDTGILVGKTDNVVAGMMIKELQGKWVQKNFKSDGKKLVYQFTKGASYGNSIMKFCIWEGFYLEEV